MDLLGRHLAELPGLLTAHLQLTLLALVIASAVSLPLGIYATRSDLAKQVAVGSASVIQTIPSLALLAIMVPLLSGVGLPGIGFLPAAIGLTLYCVLPILMSTVTGLSEVDPAMVEAARGVGMTRRQRLLRVELPLAMPVIVSGLRTATVWCVGMATLSTPIGAPSLGNYIFGGLQTRDYVSVLVGCAAATVLALLLDRVVQFLEIGARTRDRRFLALGATVLGVLVCYASGHAALSAFDRHDDQVVIGSKPFSEQYILAEFAAELIRRETDLEPVQRPSLGSTVAFDALRADEIDLYVEYTGTTWATIMNRGDVPEGRGEVLREVTAFLRDEHGVGVVASLGFENTYCLAMRRSQAEELGVRRLSDLARFAPRFAVAGDYEFFQRGEWASIETTYGMEFDEERTMDQALMYEAAGTGAVDVIGAYSTDGRIEAFDLVVLEDDRGAIPPYDAILLASPALQRERPLLVERLRSLEGAIGADLMRQMNGRVDQEGQLAEDVGRALLDAVF